MASLCIKSTKEQSLLVGQIATQMLRHAMRLQSAEKALRHARNWQSAKCALCHVQCKGQATGFVASEYYKKLNICTGKFGMFAKAKKSEGKFAAGKFCAGKSLGAFFLGEEDDAMIAEAA